MAVVIGSVLSTVSIYVFPKFQTIFKDFNIQLPLITRDTDIAGSGIVSVVW